MKIVKFIYILSIGLFWSEYTFGQNKVTKSQIFKLIKSSINQTSRKSISVGSGAWIICNQDNSFFKSDTIKLYNNINYFYQLSSCCDFIDWTFYKKNSFLQSKSQICREPASADVHVDYYQLIVIKENETLYLQINKSNLPVSKFEIVKIENIKLDNNNSTDVIVLKRQAN